VGQSPNYDLPHNIGSTRDRLRCHVLPQRLPESSATMLRREPAFAAVAARMYRCHRCTDLVAITSKHIVVRRHREVRAEIRLPLRLTPDRQPRGLHGSVPSRDKRACCPPFDRAIRPPRFFPTVPRTVGELHSDCTTPPAKDERSCEILPTRFRFPVACFLTHPLARRDP